MKTVTVWIVWAVFFCGAGVACAADSTRTTAETIVHMLDYVGVDYPATVRDGQVVNPGEFQEQSEFAARAAELMSQLPAGASRDALLATAREFAARIAAKAPGELVAREAAALRWRVIAAYDLQVAPKKAPDLKAAALLFEAQCSVCHGAQGHGDGPLAAKLEPRPSDFHQLERMQQRSVYGLYNTITLGVAGTPMRAFSELSEDQRWALAFVAANFAADPGELRRGEALWKTGVGRAQVGNMKTLATMTSAEVRAANGPDVAAVQAYLRANPVALVDAVSPIDIARRGLGESIAAYRGGDREQAQRLAVAAYLDGFEIAEPALDAADHQLRLDIESSMMGLRDAMKMGAPIAELEQRHAGILEQLAQASERIAVPGLAPATAAVSAFVILAREGLEALLVVAGILAVLGRTGRREAVRYVHYGWIAALVLGFVTWFVAGYAVTITGAGRETTEGVTALLAAVILIYVGFWLHTKAYANRWREMIDTHLQGALGKGTQIALAGVSFLAVYREAFETVLFYEALWLQAGAAAQSAVIGGLLAAMVALGVVAWVIFRYGMRVPIGKFFGASSVLMALLAVVFVGEGLAALQAAGKVGVDSVSFPTVRMLGVFPTLQTLAAQAIVLLVVIAGFAYTFYAARLARSTRAPA